MRPDLTSVIVIGKSDSLKRSSVPHPPEPRAFHWPSRRNPAACSAASRMAGRARPRSTPPRAGTRAIDGEYGHARSLRRHAIRPPSRPRFPGSDGAVRAPWAPGRQAAIVLDHVVGARQSLRAADLRGDDRAHLFPGVVVAPHRARDLRVLADVDHQDAVRQRVLLRFQQQRGGQDRVGAGRPRAARAGFPRRSADASRSRASVAAPDPRTRSGAAPRDPAPRSHRSRRGRNAPRSARVRAGPAPRPRGPPRRHRRP